MINDTQTGAFWQLGRKDIFFLTGMTLLVTTTIMVGSEMEKSGYEIRRWYTENFWIVLALLACAGLQHRVGLPPVAGSTPPAISLWKPLTAGLVFGLLDVLIIKCMLHPQPYETLPPFLQPFPYSALLYPSGALEIEVTYRLIPLTLFLLFDTLVFKAKFRPAIIIGVGVLSALVEPILQFPTGSAIWFIGYATITGIAMNALEYFFMVKNGFASGLLVRLGHYLVWHIALGLYVEYVELL